MAETGMHGDYLNGIQNDKKILTLSQLANWTEIGCYCNSQILRACASRESYLKISFT